MAEASPRVCRVLIVENDRDIQDLLEDVFSHEGFRFAIVSNGKAMREAIAASEIDVAVIDVLLPGEDGMALAKEVAADDIPVILVTGSHDHFESVEKSGHRYLFKPFRISSLLTLADELLQQSKVNCQARHRRYGT
jgi:two-component system, OmpR family, response regulator